MSTLPDARRAEEATDYATLGLFRELWNYRELFYFLALRDIKLRYKQTALGVLWAIIQPLFTMAIFTLLFGRLANIPTDGIPAPIFYFSALVPWAYFSSTLTTVGMSLVANANVLTKIYFPRIIIPAAGGLSGLVDFFVSSVLLGGFIAYYQVPLGWNLLLWPLLVVPLALLAFGVGTFLAALNIKYRDVRYAIPFGVQLLLFATPIIYPMSFVPREYQWLLALNPLSWLIEGFRYAVVPTHPLDLGAMSLSLGVTTILVVVGVTYFRRTEKAFADIV